MNRLLATLGVRLNARILRGATFCEPCSRVCPNDCRGEALRDGYRDAVQRAGLFSL